MNNYYQNDYYQKYLKYKNKYLKLKGGANISNISMCLNNFKSTDPETSMEDCWFDTGIFLMFGNPITRDYFKSLYPEINDLFSLLEDNNITIEFRNQLLTIFGQEYSILKNSNDLDIFTNFFKDSIYFFYFEIDESIIEDNKPILIIKNPHLPVKNFIIKGKEYELKSAALLSIGAKRSDRDEHFISIFECNDEWKVADNQVEDLVDYNFELDSGYKQINGLYQDYGGWKFINSMSFLLYFPKT
jgi:hypothetical protein